ncbi:uncharacterized protein LOC142560224 [Dermacentor variabilis]|uniref:uncharacterized protein LOC142560224 n=1 Tax=Dermacentor variabilis TaxID=34621 RepID=UPI003F5C54DE
MPSEHNENTETRAESSKRDQHLCFRQINVRTLRNRCHRDDQDSSPEEKSCPVPSSLPSSSQYPETDGARHIPCSGSEPSQSSVVTSSPPCVGSSLEREEHAWQTNVASLSKDVQQPFKSPEAMSDSVDDSARDCVSPAQPTGYLHGAANSGPMCRICYEGDQEYPLVSPCCCTGTMGFVHVSCLEHWLNEQNVDICELCETYGARHIPASDSEPSQSSAIPPQLAYVDSSLEGEDHEDARLPLLSSPEAISDSEDHPGRNCVSSDKPTSYINVAASSGPMCRICHEGDQEDPLVSPCNCSGTMGFVHVSCLEHWLNERNVDICELCGQRFPMAAQPGSMRRFFHYVSRNEVRLRRALLSDLFYVAMVTSAAVFSLVMQATALKALERKCFVWKLIVLFVTGAFHSCCVTRVSNRLRRRYHLFMTWQLENPVRRIVAVTSVSEVPDGRT